MMGCQRRLVSLSSCRLPLCHGRGREFESRPPNHSFAAFAMLASRGNVQI